MSDNIEIERRYLVNISSWISPSTSETICQGYLSLDPYRLVRVRISSNYACLTIKGKKVGSSCPEFEYKIPADDAMHLLDLCLLGMIRKTRYTDKFAGKTWYVDVFHGNNQGLVLAEIELDCEEEQYDLPPWVGREVTNDPCYSNASLVSNPYSKWTENF